MFPSLKEEIERKSFETLGWLVNSLQKGKISEDQFSTGIDAVFMTAAGLNTDKDFVQLITASQSECEGHQAYKKLHFVKENEIQTFSWIYGEEDVLVMRRVDGVVTAVKRRNFATAEMAKKIMDAVPLKMMQEGWEAL